MEYRHSGELVQRSSPLSQLATPPQSAANMRQDPFCASPGGQLRAFWGVAHRYFGQIGPHPNPFAHRASKYLTPLVCTTTTMEWR